MNVNQSKTILSDDDINKHWYGSWGESDTPREILYGYCLKRACGYYSGYTLSDIATKLGLVTEKRKQLTKLGQRFLWESTDKTSRC